MSGLDGLDLGELWGGGLGYGRGEGFWLVGEVNWAWMTYGLMALVRGERGLGGWTRRARLG